MESGRRALGHGRQAPPSIELGNEPPLGLDGDVEEPIDRRRVSIRWLAATVLAAVAGGGLMGGAVYAALDGEYRFAQVPETVRSTLRGALAAGERPTNAARNHQTSRPAYGSPPAVQARATHVHLTVIGKRA